MRSLSALIVSLSIAYSAIAQTPPLLAKEWRGRVSVTSMGSVGKHNPKDESNVGKDKSVTGWNTYDEPRSLVITRQVGQHIDAIWKSARADTPLVGTISFDGKQIQLIGRYQEFSMNIDGDKMYGCGNTRGQSGLFEHWLKNYAAHCTELSAVK